MDKQVTIRHGAFLEGIGDQILFFVRFVRNLFSRGFEWNEWVRQCYIVGYKSFSIVAITGFVLGFVLTLQTLPSLRNFGAQALVPSMVAESMVREVGPVIVALICAGKIASSIGAELGSMKVTEQIEAMEVSGANPMQYLVVTRILACTLMVPLLTCMADGIALCGGFIGTNISGNMSSVLYFRKAMSILDFSDLFPALIKTVLFGFVIGLVGCYKGFQAESGTASVGRAANSAVVAASVWIIILDALAVQLTSSIVYN
jgi:phospholipid/cholesterol/gamma-HCH transport system permease protein